MKYNVNKRFNCDNKFPPLKKNIPKYITIFLLLILISYLNCKEIRKVSTITGFSVTGVRTFWTCPLKICFLFIDAFSNFFFLAGFYWLGKETEAGHQPPQIFSQLLFKYFKIFMQKSF